MAIAQHNSTINAKRFAALFAGFDTGNDSEEEAMAKVRVMRRMAEEAGLRIIDVLELPEVKHAIDEQLNPKRSESPDLAVAVERISELENELCERMSDVRTLADRLAQQQPASNNAQVSEPTVAGNPFVRNDLEPLPPSVTEAYATNGQAAQYDAASGWDGSAQLSIFHRVFWGCFLAFILAYAVASWSISRPIATLDDVDAFQYWPVIIIAGFLFVAAFVYFGADLNDLDDPDNVRASLTSPRAMFFSVVGLAVPWGMLYTGWAQVMHQPLPDNVRIVCLLTIAASWWLLSGRRHWQNFGGRGVVLNLLLCIGLVYPCLVLPLEISSSTSTMIKSVLASMVFGSLICSDWLANWIFESDSRFRGFAIVGAIFSLMTVVMIHEDIKASPATAHHHAATAAVPDSSSEYVPQPPNAKYKWRIRKVPLVPRREDVK